jgi:hypothetical protein
MNKPTGLAAFTRKGAAFAQQTTTDREQTTEARRRGKGDVVALTVRLPRAEWRRVHQLALDEGVSIQQLAVDGLSRLFTERGLPPLSV